MTFNWGTGITIFFLFFATSMTLAVVATTRHPPQLVQKDYYVLDLNYQARLDQKQNTSALATAPTLRFEAATQSFVLTLPAGLVPQSGQVKGYRGATTRDDFSVDLQPAAVQAIPAAGLAPGRWHLEVTWTDQAGKSYFWETAVVTYQ